MCLVASLASKIQRRGFGARAPEAFGQLPEQFRCRAFPFNAFAADICGFMQLRRPDIAFDRALLKAPFTAFRIRNCNFYLHGLHAILAKRDRITSGSSRSRQGCRQTDTPEAMDLPALNLQISIGRVIRILIPRPEFCHPGFDQFAGNTLRMVNRGLVLPFGPEVLACSIKISPVTMTGHGHIGQMPVHHAAGKHKGPVDSRALGLVDGHGIAVIDVAITVLTENNLAAAVEPDRKKRRAERVAGGDHRAEHAVPDILRTVSSCTRFEETGVLEKDNPIACRKLPHATLCPEAARAIERSLFPHHLAQGFIQPVDIPVGVRQHQQRITPQLATTI